MSKEEEDNGWGTTDIVVPKFTDEVCPDVLQKISNREINWMTPSSAPRKERRKEQNK